ncbi:MAG: flagellar basal body L-ring protein FlgH [Alphaproteobacteria bacterium]|jgi:flagellar L-ring protein precursor FlgH|nr:flagellar basal body L-ring protein FlgH [Alphaproteobacteria bacterium]
MVPSRRSYRSFLAVAAVALLSGCSAMERIGQVGQTPDFRPIANPTQEPDYYPVSLPMPSPQPINRHANSLWRSGARAFFKDQRASVVGDILTVEIQIDDDANITNETTRTRDNIDTSAISSLFGYEASLDRILPQAVNGATLLNIDTDLRNKGTGEIKRDDQINLKIAAVVTQVLPNGNLVIRGDQEVRVNFELRELSIDGVVRPADITATNTVSYEKIASARIAYGGRGHISDVQQPRYGAQVLDVINPF